MKNIPLVVIGLLSLFNTSFAMDYTPVDTQKAIKTGYISNFVKKSVRGNASYAILGDSITDAGNVIPDVTGGASSPDKGYASLVSSMMNERYDGVSFTNRGIGGNTVMQAFERVDADIIPYNYDLVILELGTNDWNKGVSLESFERDYRLLVDTLISKTDSDLILVSLGYFGNWTGPYSFTRETDYNKIIQKIAIEHNLGFVDTYTAMKREIDNGTKFEDITFAPDPVHPNDKGHQIWANEIFTWLDFVGYYSPIKPDNFNYKRITSMDSIIKYEGDWRQQGPYNSVIGGLLKSSYSLGASASYSFEGERVKLYFVKDNDCGKVKISVDGQVIYSEYDLYRSTFSLAPIVIENLPSGLHTIKVEVAAGKNEASSSSRVAFNALETYKY